MTRLLIRNAELPSGLRWDVLIADARIQVIAEALPNPGDCREIDAAGGALLPGLNDHHLHLAALAAARNSLHCGPPQVTNSGQLTQLLQEKAADLGEQEWLRGIGYHESVAGEIDVAWLDAQVSHCPVRIQHRGGRLWVFNSPALERLAPKPGDAFERKGGRLTGRLIDGDALLRARRGATFPDLGAVSGELASYGITGVTDTTPQNNWDTLEHFEKAIAGGAFKQSLLMMGDASLDEAKNISGHAQVGAHKFHLLESRLPDLDATIAAIARSHDSGRNAAFHCVTRTELVFALAALDAAGVRAGDRIEHASITPPELAGQIREMAVAVVTQPVFVAERGDQYLQDVATEDQPWLYRLQGLLQAGIALAGSSDAPFGSVNPWRAMHSAVSRRTQSGVAFHPQEALSPEQALGLYTSPLSAPGQVPPALREGAEANLCLLPVSWAAARADLSQVKARLTLKSGRQIHNTSS